MREVYEGEARIVTVDALSSSSADDLKAREDAVANVKHWVEIKERLRYWCFYFYDGEDGPQSHTCISW
jgi:hypothetical protein